MDSAQGCGSVRFRSRPLEPSDASPKAVPGAQKVPGEQGTGRRSAKSWLA